MDRIVWLDLVVVGTLIGLDALDVPALIVPLPPTQAPEE